MSNPPLLLFCLPLTLLSPLLAQPPLPEQDKTTQSILRDQETQIRTFKFLRPRLLRLKAKLQKEGRAESASLIQKALEEMDKLDLQAQMATVVEDLRLGKTYESLDRARRVAAGLRKVIRILTERDDKKQKLEDKLNQIADFREAIADYKEMEKAIQKETRKARTIIDPATKAKVAKMARDLARIQSQHEQASNDLQDLKSEAENRDLALADALRQITAMLQALKEPEEGAQGERQIKRTAQNASSLQARDRALTQEVRALGAANDTMQALLKAGRKLAARGEGAEASKPLSREELEALQAAIEQAKQALLKAQQAAKLAREALKQSSAETSGEERGELVRQAAAADKLVKHLQETLQKSRDTLKGLKAGARKSPRAARAQALKNLSQTAQALDPKLLTKQARQSRAEAARLAALASKLSQALEALSQGSEKGSPARAKLQEQVKAYRQAAESYQQMAKGGAGRSKNASPLPRDTASSLEAAAKKEPAAPSPKTLKATAQQARDLSRALNPTANPESGNQTASQALAKAAQSLQQGAKAAAGKQQQEARQETARARQQLRQARAALKKARRDLSRLRDPLRRLAAREKDLSRRLDQVTRKLAAQNDQQGAPSLDRAQAAMEDAKDAMEQAANSMQRGRTEAASNQEERASTALQEAMDALNQALGAPENKAQQEQRLKKLAKAQEELQDKLKSLAQALQEKEISNKARQAVDQSGQKMGEASRNLQQQQAQEAQQKEQEAQDYLDQADEALKKKALKYEDLQQEELLFNLMQEVSDLIKVQEAINASTTRMELAREDAGRRRHTRHDRRAILRLSSKQKDSQKKLLTLSTAIRLEQGKNPLAFIFVMERIEKDMGRIEKRLKVFDTGPLTLHLEEKVLENLKELQLTLKDEIEARRKAKQQKQQQQQNQKQPLVSPVAELLLIRRLQQRWLTNYNRFQKRAPTLDPEGDPVDESILEDLIDSQNSIRIQFEKWLKAAKLNLDQNKAPEKNR